LDDIDEIKISKTEKEVVWEGIKESSSCRPCSHDDSISIPTLHVGGWFQAFFCVKGKEIMTENW